MKNVGRVFVVEFPITSIFELKAGLRDFDRALRRTVDQIVDGVGHFTEKSVKRRPIGRHAGEDEATVGLDAWHSNHSVARIVEIETRRITLAVGNRCQAPVAAKGPAMIGTNYTRGSSPVRHA